MSQAPHRIQRQRAKGWKMPADTVYVGRPSKWGNPFIVSDGSCSHPDCGPHSHPPITAQMAVASYRDWLLRHRQLMAGPLESLRGKNLACWCPLDKPCHADVLLEIANAPDGVRP